MSIRKNNEQAKVGWTEKKPRRTRNVLEDQLFIWDEHGTIYQIVLENPLQADADGLTMLHYAAMRGEEEVLWGLVEDDPDMNVQDNELCTPLHRAAAQGQEEMVQLLVMEFEVDTSIENATGGRPLDDAQLSMDSGAFETLAEGVSMSPLHQYAYEGDVDGVKAQVAVEDPNVRDARGWTALHYMAYRGHVDAMDAFLEKAGELVDLNAMDGESRTPFDLAVMKGYIEIVGLLVDAGVDINGVEGGHVPIVLAASFGQVGAVTFLLDHGAAVDATDENDQTALIMAASKGHEDTAEVLIDAGADIEARDCYGETPLISAMLGEHQNVAKLLIHQGADIHGQSPLARPLHVAAMVGLKSVARLLIAKGVDVNAKAHRGDTALDFAEKSDDHRLAAFLRRHGGRSGSEVD